MVEPDRGREEKGIGEEQRGIWGRKRRTRIVQMSALDDRLGLLQKCSLPSPNYAQCLK
jgi:hypothetical protein